MNTYAFNQFVDCVFFALLLLLSYSAYHPSTGRLLEVYADQPGVQFYTSNSLPDPDNNVSNHWSDITETLNNNVFQNIMRREYLIIWMFWIIDLSKWKRACTESTQRCSQTCVWKRRCTILQARSILFRDAKFSRCCKPCNCALYHLFVQASMIWSIWCHRYRHS